MKDLSTGKESRLILHFATPMLLGNIFQQLYNVVDSIVIGNFIGTEALAAVGASFPIIFTLVSLVMGIAIGATVIISQYYGAKDIEQVKRAIDTLYVFIFLASIVVTVIGIIASDAIFRLIKLPEEVIPQASLYLRIYFSGMILFFGFNGTSAILRGLGDSKTPLFFMVISTISNILLDLLFVVGFGWGIAGAAVATVVAQGGAFVTAILYLNKKHPIINLSWRRLIFDRDIFMKNIKIGFPIGFQQAFVALGMIMMYWLVNPFGTATVAAYSVVFRIDSFAGMPAMNFAAALSTFVGQNLGAGKPDRIRTGLSATFRMTSLIAVSISLILVVFSRGMISLFTSDPEVIEIGAKYLQIVSPFYIVFTTMFVVGGVMRGAGDTLIPMIITFFALWVVRIPACYLLAQKLGATGIWWGIPMAWAIGLILSYSYYRTGKWKSRVIVKHEQP